MCRSWTHLCTSNTSFPTVCQPCCLFLWPLCGLRSGSQLTGIQSSPAFCQLSSCHHCRPRWGWGLVWGQLSCFQLWLWGRTCRYQHRTSDRAITAFCQLSGCHHCQPWRRLDWGQLRCFHFGLWLWDRTSGCQHSTGSRANSAFC